MTRESFGPSAHITPGLEDESGATLDGVPYYADMREAFGRSGCPLCRMLALDAERQLDAVLWEMVSDTRLRRELNQARGYCQQHGWMLVRPGAALGVAILMKGVTGTLLDVLAAHPVNDSSAPVRPGLLRRLGRLPGLQNLLDGPDQARGSGTTAELVAALSPQSPCPVCLRLQGREEEYVSTLLAHLVGAGALEEVYRASDGLCLSHFRKAVARAPSETHVRALVAGQRSVWERLHGELEEFIRKSDHRSRDEPFGAEKDAWIRALEGVSGPRPASTSRRQGLTQSM